MSKVVRIIRLLERRLTISPSLCLCLCLSVRGGSSLLCDVGVRGGLLHDLLELEAFLLQRRAELQEDEQGGMTSLVLAYTATAQSQSPFATLLQNQNVATTGTLHQYHQNRLTSTQSRPGSLQQW